MKTFIFALMAVATCATLESTPAAARDYPFCLTGRDFAGFGDCKFDSYAQCQATASGRDASCAANPFLGYYDGVASAPSRRRIVR